MGFACPFPFGVEIIGAWQCQLQSSLRPRYSKEQAKKCGGQYARNKNKQQHMVGFHRVGADHIGTHVRDGWGGSRDRA